MQSTVHINVSAIDYDATSRALATVLDRMQDMIHGKEEFRITDSEAAFGWHFFVVTVNERQLKNLLQFGRRISKREKEWKRNFLD